MLLLLVQVIGKTHLGAARWLQFGPIGLQPSEIMKIGLVLALARFYHGLPSASARWSWWLLVPAAMIAVPALLVAKQPDLGTAILLAATGGAVVMLAGLSLRAIAVAVAGVIPAVVLAWALYAFNLLSTGPVLVLFFLNLMVMGWAVALAVISLILRHGAGAEAFARAGRPAEPATVVS